MATFPHQYETTVTRTRPSQARIEAAPRAVIDGGAPPEFGGEPTVWSPEHLLISALALCVETTFDAYAARDKLEVHAWRARVVGTLDKTAKGLAFTAFAVDVDIVVDPADTARAEAVMHRAERACIVSNALVTPVTVTTHVRGAAGAAA